MELIAFIIKSIFLNGQIIDSFQIVHLEEHLFKWQRVDILYKSIEEEKSVWKYKDVNTRFCAVTLDAVATFSIKMQLFSL